MGSEFRQIKLWKHAPPESGDEYSHDKGEPNGSHEDHSNHLVSHPSILPASHRGNKTACRVPGHLIWNPVFVRIPIPLAARIIRQ
jgi:hypothetical protein